MVAPKSDVAGEGEDVPEGGGSPKLRLMRVAAADSCFESAKKDTSHELRLLVYRLNFRRFAISILLNLTSSRINGAVALGQVSLTRVVSKFSVAKIIGGAAAHN
jgi:hypothetical protein